MIDARDAASAASEALRQLRGGGHEAALAAAATAQPDTPIFVRRLDRPQQSYFLVPLRDSRGIVLVVEIDSATGAMRSCSLLPAPVDRLIIPVETARSLVACRAALAGEPELVWRPCRESMTPLRPFYRVPLEEGETFVTADGDIRDRLTAMGKGG